MVGQAGEVFATVTANEAEIAGLTREIARASQEMRLIWILLLQSRCGRPVGGPVPWCWAHDGVHSNGW